jgi:hypothetical protein
VHTGFDEIVAETAEHTGADLPRRIDRRDQIGKDAVEISHVGDQASKSDDPFNPPGLAGAGIRTCGKNPNGGKVVTARPAARSHREQACQSKHADRTIILASAVQDASGTVTG